MAATDMLRGRQTAFRTLTNRSGGGVVLGDVVVIGDGTNDNSFTTTTTAHFKTRKVGIAMETIASNAAGLVAVGGYVPIVNTGGALTRGHFLYTSTVAKEATGSALCAPGAFGEVLESGTDMEAYIYDANQRGMVELDYVEFTSDVSVTATTEGTANTVVTATALTFDGATPVMVEAWASWDMPEVSAGSMTIWLYDSGSSVGALGTILNPGALAATVAGSRHPTTFHRRLTPSAAAHTYSIRASVGSGTGTVKAGAGGAATLFPGYVRIVAV